MDKSILKKFAIESREMLMTAVENKLNKYYVDEELEKTQSGDLIILKNNRITLQPLTFEEFNKRATLISRIKDLSEDGSFESGKKYVIEETAYTWFNRIVAIRYMELNDMLPLTKDNQSLGIRVLSSINNESHPEILKLGNLTNTGLDLKIDFDKYNKIINENEQFNYVLKLICNKLGTIIPQIFDGITDYIDLLLPDNLLSNNGFITKIITEVPESDFRDGVEILGWLYQYWNIEEFNRIYDGDMSNIKIDAHSIPAATQLFTPDWVVKYMVENSLGKYWLEYNNDSNLTSDWKYYIEDDLSKQKERVKVTDIKFLDPCCGSGHILVYAFEVFYQIYKEQGYNKNDISELILTNNLYGLDIDDRAGQLSILSILLKAREYDHNIFNKNIISRLNVMSIQETNSITETDLNIIKDENENAEIIDYIYEKFQNAKEIGSLLLLENKDYSQLLSVINNINDRISNIFDIEKIKVINEKIVPVLKIAKIMSNQYEIVVTNPPYMNRSKMCNKLSNYCVNNFKDATGDLATAFVERIIYNYVKPNGYSAFITTISWMYLQSFERMRKKLLNNQQIISMVDFGTELFEGKIGHLPIVSWVQKKNKPEKNFIAIRLSDFCYSRRNEKKEEFYNKDNYYYANQNDLQFIPGTPVSYWTDSVEKDLFENNETLADVSDIKKGLSTCDNDRFIRNWYEVCFDKIGIGLDHYQQPYKWIPVNKGGEFRKWYGNNDYIINWENDGEEIKNFQKSVIRNKEYYFKKSLTWTMISGTSLSVRISEQGKIFEGGGPSLFTNNEYYEFILAILLSKLGSYFVSILNPTLNININDIGHIPFLYNKEIDSNIKEFVSNCIKIARDDWDDFENSWGFKKHPLINCTNKKDVKLSDLFSIWNEKCRDRFKELKQNEEQINKVLISAYGLTNKLTAEVDDKFITVKLSNKEREIKSLISYAVGCMFGRYSLDEDGLIYTGENFDINRYKTFEVDLDNIIPVTEEKCFKDDIVERFIHFIEVVYGKKTLNENLDYIADTLGRKSNEDAEDTIRRYFVNDFYKDHIKIYQKKPIYWMFESGKKNGFKCLIYMHRYDENLVAKIRLDYLDKIQRIYEARLQEIKTDLEDSNLSNYDVKKLEKEQESLQIKLEEIKKYNDKLSTIGNKKISIDLDDGVTENYKKFIYVDPITNKESSILAEEKIIIPKKK